MSQRASHTRFPAPRAVRARHRSAGFSLIELMVAMLLGLIVIAGAASVFVASSATYKSNQGLSEVQTNARIAFELLTRDVRQAGLSGCTDNGRVANVLASSPNAGGTAWWADWNNAVHGYDSTQSDPALTTGTAPGDRAPNTDSIQLIGADGEALSVASTPSGPSANFKLSQTQSDLQSGDIIVVCDPDHAAIVQVTVQNGSNVTLVHNTGNKTSPGNCSDGLGYPTSCGNGSNGNSYTFGQNSQVARYSASDWYVGYNSAGGFSLFRKTLQAQPSSNSVTLTAQEMVRNVTDMQIKYHQSPNTDFVDATNVTDWSKVDAVSIQLTLDSTDQRAGTDQKPIVRTFTSVTTLRNRVH